MRSPLCRCAVDPELLIELERAARGYIACPLHRTARQLRAEITQRDLVELQDFEERRTLAQFTSIQEVVR